jgi:hypothetical protein
VVAITRRERLDLHFVATVLSEFPVTKRSILVQHEKDIPRRRNVKTLIALVCVLTLFTATAGAQVAIAQNGQETPITLVFKRVSP